MIKHHLCGKMSCNRKWGGQHPPYLDHEGIVGGILDFFFFSRQVRMESSFRGVRNGVYVRCMLLQF